MKKVLPLTAIVLVFSAICFSDTIHVPADQPTIQEGVDAAGNGDVVIVAPGTYFERIEISDKAITLKSETCADETVIDGSGFGRVFSYDSYGYPETVLRGFTLRNGYYSYGGAIFIMAGSLSVFDCTFENNEAMYGGGAFHSWGGSSPKFIRCTFKHNYAFFGGGMNFQDSSDPIIRECIFIENHADFGGAINAWGAEPTIINCFFQTNRGAKSGGALELDGASGRIVQCTFWNNSSANGAAIYSYGDTSIVQCVFYFNRAVEGGAIWNSGGHGVSVRNCIAWRNIPDQFYDSSGSGSLSVEHCCVEGGFPGTGNIDADPLFVRAYAGDFHIQYSSPCRNAGHNNIPNLPSKDFEGDDRTIDGAVDIGVDEFGNHLYCTGNFQPNKPIRCNIVGFPDNTPAGLFLGTRMLDPPLQLSWGEFHLDNPWMFLSLVPLPSNGVLEMPTNLPSLPAPYDIPMQALINYELSNLFVLEVR